MYFTEIVISIATSPLGFGLLFAALFVLWSIFAVLELKWLKEHPEEPQNVDLDWLRHPYKSLVDKLRHGLPKVLLPKTVTEDPPPSGMWKRLEWLVTPHAANPAHRARLTRNPWSWPVLDLALRVALAYPIVFASMAWVFYAPTQIGGFQVFPEDAALWPRLALLCSLALFLASGILASARSKGVVEKLSTWLDWPELAVAGAFAVAVAGAFAVAFAVAGAVAGAFAVAGAVFWCARQTIVLRSRVRDYGLPAYAALMGCVFSTGLIVLPYLSADAKPLVVFLLLLPLTNALFDWLSYGTTLWLIDFGWQKQEGGKSHWVWLTGLPDCIAALVFFGGLSLAILFSLHAANVVSGEQLFDLAALLDQVEANHWDVLWIIAMIGSTLLPTFVHLCFAGLGLLTLIPTRRWDSMILKSDGRGSSILYRIWFPTEASIFTALALVIPFGIGWLVWTYGGGLVDIYVQILRSVAGSFGLFAPLPTVIAT